jgi:hypothetical protein
MWPSLSVPARHIGSESAILFLKQMRALHSPIPVVLVSGASNAHLEAALANGVSAVFPSRYSSPIWNMSWTISFAREIRIDEPIARPEDEVTDACVWNRCLRVQPLLAHEAAPGAWRGLIQDIAPTAVAGRNTEKEDGGRFLVPQKWLAGVRVPSWSVLQVTGNRARGYPLAA